MRITRPPARPPPRRSARPHREAIGCRASAVKRSVEREPADEIPWHKAVVGTQRSVSVVAVGRAAKLWCLHVRARQRPAVHRGPRRRRPHPQGPCPRPDGPRPDGRARRRARPGHRRAGVGLLRAARGRAVADRRLGDRSRARRQARLGDRRPRHAAHLRSSPTSARTSPASASATTRWGASGTCRAPRRAPPARSSRSSTGPPAPRRG